MKTIIGLCNKCGARIELNEVVGLVSPTGGQWFEFKCGHCDGEGYICKRDYIKWLEVAKRRR